MSQTFRRSADEPQYTMLDFAIFMLFFWPSALILGLIDFYLIPSYDLRIPTLLLALGVGWIGMSKYRAREQEDGD
jgi:hypothetical protein